jgi:hypothetical protein
MNFNNKIIFLKLVSLFNSPFLEDHTPFHNANKIYEENWWREWNTVGNDQETSCIPLMNWRHVNLYHDILFLKVSHLIVLLNYQSIILWNSKWITEMASAFVELGISERYTSYEFAPSVAIVKLHVIHEGIWYFLRLTSSNDTEVLWLPYVSKFL